MIEDENRKKGAKKDSKDPRLCLLIQVGINSHDASLPLHVLDSRRRRDVPPFARLAPCEAEFPAAMIEDE
jgi:hypothetical protein